MTREDAAFILPLLSRKHTHQTRLSPSEFAVLLIGESAANFLRTDAGPIRIPVFMDVGRDRLLKRVDLFDFLLKLEPAKESVVVIEMQKSGKRRIEIELPTANVIVAELLKLRPTILEGIRRSADGEQFETPHGVVVTAQLRASLVAAALLTLFIGLRANAKELQEEGLAAGLLREAELLALELPLGQWSEGARRLLQGVQRRLPAGVSGFVLPTESDGGTLREDVDPAERIRRERRVDESRMLFYMTVDGYHSLRTVLEGNPDRYSGVVFENGTAERVLVLDTPIIGNALFVLRGALSDLMAVARGTRTEIRSSRFFCERIIHHGDWRPRVRQAVLQARTGDRCAE